RAAILELEPAQLPAPDEIVEMRAHSCDASAEAIVVDEPGGGENAARLRCPQSRGADELPLAGDLRLQIPARDHPFGQIVEALELLAAGDGQLSGRPERVEHPLRRLPVPHSAAAAALEVAAAQRAAIADGGEHAAGQRGIGVDDRSEPVVDATHAH